jgi:hypothetical protein
VAVHPAAGAASLSLRPQQPQLHRPPAQRAHGRLPPGAQRRLHDGRGRSTTST